MDKHKVAKNGAILGICALIVVLAITYGRHLMHSDPFARFSHMAPSGRDVMAKLNDVDLVQYHKDQLVGKAHIGELDLRQDQQTFDMSKVYDGMVMTDQGRINFSADSASWDAARLYLTVNSGAHVANKDFDVEVPTFTFDQRAGSLEVPREIRGKFFGGEITAKQFFYNVNTRDGRIGPAIWVGKPKIQETESDNNTAWTFQTNGATLHHGDTETWHDATATDGNIIVQAPLIDRNTKTDVITATGGCLYWSKKADIACDKVVVYRQEKRAVLSGNVRMLIKPKDDMVKTVKADKGEIPVFHPEVPANVAASAPLQGESQQDKDLDDEVRSGKTTRKYPTVVISSNVEYWYAKGNRHATITGDPQATQNLAGDRWRRVWATSANYDGEADTIKLLRGDKEVEMKDSLGEDIFAKNFEFSTQENNEDWTGEGMHGTVVGESSGQGDDQTGSSKPPVDKNPPPPGDKSALKGAIGQAKTIQMLQDEKRPKTKKPNG